MDAAFKGNGYGAALMEHCISYAKERQKSGICMLGAKKQKAWLSDQSFAKKYGFEVVDTTADGYELLALSFDENRVQFTKQAKAARILNQEITIYYTVQCPYTYHTVENLRRYCKEHELPASFILVDTLQKAKELPCVFNNFALFYQGEFITVNLIDPLFLERLLKRGRGQG